MKPNPKAQMIGPRTAPEDLDFRAWEYYYKHMNCPITPLLFECVKSAIKAEETKD